MDKKQGIIKDIKHYEYITGNKYDVVESLVKKGYTEEEIIKGFNSYKFKNNWNGNILGVFMIVLSIFIAVSIQSTFGSFSYEFDSRGDFIRLNEWVLKPFFILVSLLIGINISTNRGFCDKQSKIIMIVSYSLFMITSISSHNALPLLYVPAGIILFSILKISKPSELSNGELVLNAVKNGTDKKQALKQVSIRTWKGSYLFIILFLAYALFINSPIHIKTGLFELSLLEKILSINIKLLSFGCFIAAILIGINLRKFKWILVGLIILSFMHIILSVFHNNFQVSIFPASIITIFGVLMGNLKSLFLSLLGNKK